MTTWMLRLSIRTTLGAFPALLPLYSALGCPRAPLWATPLASLGVLPVFGACSARSQRYSLRAPKGAPNSVSLQLSRASRE